jgi:peptidoglycan-associated lipoprotein
MTTRDSLLVFLIVSIIALGGCAQKTATTEQPAAPPTASAPAAESPAAQEPRPPAEAPAGPAPRSVAAPGSAAPASPAAAAPQSVDEFTDEPALRDVFFDPGRADIGRSGAKLMRDNARWIVENRDYLVLIEGYTDYKGSADANRAMGDRRAKAAVSFLLKEGVPDTRLWTVSYGSDRPVCAEKTEACAAKNRRVHFRVKKQ